jgi:hypothetical protein
VSGGLISPIKGEALKSSFLYLEKFSPFAVQSNGIITDLP